MKSAKVLIVCLLLSLYPESVLGARGETVVAKKKADLDRIEIPVVKFDNKSIKEAIDFAWSRAVELDNLTLESGKKGVSISVRFPGQVYPAFQPLKPTPLDKADTVKINYQAREVTLTKLLIDIAKRAGFDLYTTDAGVVFCPPASSPFPNSYADKGAVWEVLFKTEETESKVIHK